MTKITRRRAGRLIAAGLVAGVLGGCAGFDGPRTVTVSQAQLEALLARSFPMQRRLLVFEVEVPAPALQLLPERNRLGADVAIDVADRLSGQRWRGRLSLESALRFEPSDTSLRLAQVRVRSFDVEPASAAPSSRLRNLGAVLGEQVLEGLAVWRASEKQAERLRASGLSPGAVTVTPAGVQIELAPAPR